MKKRILLDLAHIDETAKVTRALSSPVRLRILRLLIRHSCNITEIAQEFNQPVSSIANHVRVLEESGLITSSERPGVRGSQKVCGIAFDAVYFNAYLPDSASNEQRLVYPMSIGNYFDCAIEGPCGLISEQAYLGTEDEPAVFYRNERVHAQLLWFHTGFVEYRFPLDIEQLERVERLVFTMELCSEAPGYNNQWPSDISILVNGYHCGIIHSTGDYGGSPGSLNPTWWPASRTQYGMLHHVEINHHATYIDAIAARPVDLVDILSTDKPYLSLRIEVREDAENVGGLNLFGEKFGNHPQGLQLEVYLQPEDSVDG